MIEQISLYIAWLGVNFVNALILLFPIIAIGYFAHAIYTRKPLKQILKEIKP